MKLPDLENAPQVSVTRVSKNGTWVSINNEELFLPFEDFPWFKDAPLRKLLRAAAPKPRPSLARDGERSTP